MPINPNNLLSYPVWLALDIQTKLKLATMFDIPRRGTVQTINGFGMIQDGFEHSDLARITRESMQEKGIPFHDDFYKMFDLLIKKVEGKEETHEKTTEESKEVRPSAAGKAKRAAKGSEGVAGVR
jgi:hypothetical protein